MHWSTHPHLQGRLRPEHPDDLQVIVHDGGPRLTDRHPEAVWVTITDSDATAFTGRVLNAPAQLRSVRQGDTIRFVARTGVEHALMITDKYLAERPAWTIHPCDRCGLTELFDAPSDLIKVVFPGLPAGSAPEMFTAICPLCGGVQGVESAQGSENPVVSEKKPWWRFWARG